MQTVKRFYWFATHSWSYLQGQRVEFFRGFVPAWRSFNQSCKKDEAEA